MRALLFLMFFSFTTGYAQTLNDIREQIEKGQIDKAKETVDQFLANQKNKGSSDAWFYKAWVYSSQASHKAELQLAQTAYEALKQYVGLEEGKDASNRLLLSKLNGHRTFFDTYTALFKAGATAFNKKDYANAYKGFSGSAEVFDILAKYKMTEVPFDTTSTLYAGVAAESANMPEQAVKFYKKIVDLKILDTAHVGVYGYLINYYTGNKDFATANSFIDKAETLFPAKGDAWMSFRIELGGSDSLTRLKQYESLLKRYPNHLMLNNDYAVELYRYVYFNDSRAGDTVWVNKLKSAYRNAVKFNSSAINNYVMMTILWDDVNWIKKRLDKIQSDETAKKAALQKDLHNTQDELLKYAKQCAASYGKMQNLKASDKANYKRALDNIIDIYTEKGLASEAKEYDAIRKSL